MATEEKQLSKKGLAKGSIGLIAAIAIGISCIAPDYTLTATLGSAAGTVGQYVPSIVWLGLIPMLLVALAYRELNHAIPDSGTSFTWGARALGPRFGWLAGWGLIASTIVVLASLAQIAVTFLYETIDWIVRLIGHNDFSGLVDLNDNHWWFNVISVVLLIAGATWFCYRDIKLTARFQYIMVAFQLLAVFAFAVVAIVKVATGTATDNSLHFSIDMLNPVSTVQNYGFGGLVSGLTVAVFIYWGWDVVLTITEETKDPQRTPGRGAAWTIILITVYYLIVSTAAIMFAGVGDTGIGLNGPEIQEGANVFATLAVPVLGPTAAILVFLAVLSSSVASLESTFVSPARTMLAMGHYGAMGPKFAKTSRFATPGTATIVAGCVAGGYYAIMRPLSDNILSDTMLTTAIFICFYYGLTAVAAFWYFRKQWFTSARNVFFKFFCPLLGGLFLLFMFCYELFLAPLISSDGVSAFSPDYGSGSSIGGGGLVGILSILILLLGVGFLIYNSVKYPAFFHRETTRVPVAVAVSEGLDEHFNALTDEDIDNATGGENFAVAETVKQ